MLDNTNTWYGHAEFRHRYQRNNDDLGREYENGAHGALDLVLLDRYQVRGGVDERLHQLGCVRRVLRLAVKKSVRSLESLIAEKGAADHEQRRHRPAPGR